MEEIKPKKERKFLKAMGDIALVLFRELVLGIGKKVINKVGNKRQGLVIAFALVAGISYASIDSIPYPITGNKQRLGWQTSGNGLVYRGRAADTITKPSSYVDKNVKAYLLVDSVLGTIFVWRQTYWDSIKVNTRLMPFDSITFNTAKNGTVGVGEVEYNDTQGSLIQGLKGGNVTNVIGQQLHQRVNNRTGAPLAKGDVVYLAGSQGNRITVAKGLAVTDAFSANTFGVVAETIADNQSGFIITEGLITGLNTSALTEDSAVYLSPTIAGALTSTKPQAPQHSVYIGVCVKSNNGSGELFVKIRNGQELDELHDVRISSPVDRASLYYSGGLWRDTTAALLVSDTASMLLPYLRDVDTVTLSNRINAKLNLSDTSNMLVPYLRKADTTSMLLPYFRDADTSQLNLTSRFNTKLNLSDTASMLTNYLRTGTAASTYLPLTGGTLTGTINRQEGSHDGSASTFYYNILNYFAKRDNNKGNQTAQITFTDRPGTSNFPNNVRTSDIYLMTAKNWNGTSLGQYLDTTLSVVADQDGGRIGISKLNPAYKLDVNGTFNASGNSLIGGTLGVTGATTLTGGINGNIKTNGASGATATPDNIWLGNNWSNGTTSDKLKIYLYNGITDKYGFGVGGSGDIQYHSDVFHDFYIANTKKFFISATNTTTDNIFTVNNAAIFNEGAADSDFRVESVGNNNMIFVDASTNRVGIGTNSPTKTLDVNGELNVLSAGTFGGRLNTNWLERTYSNSTSTSLTVSVNTTWLKLENNSTITLTLPNAATYPGKELHIKNTGTGAVNSLSSNIEPLNSTTIGTAILASGGGKWATLVSDGTYWVIMAGN